MPPYKHAAGTFTNKDGLDIFHQRWMVDDPQGAVLIVHGLGEHSGRCGHLLEAMSGARVCFFALDHQGHGRSGGKRGHVKDFADYAADIKQYIDQIVRKESPGLPLICLGHSMGGLISTLFALTHPSDITALILSAPAFVPAVKVPAIQAAAARIVSRFLPRLTQSNKLLADHLSHDPSTIATYQADPLVHDRVSTAWFVSFQATAAKCLERAGELTLPLLVIHGTEDKLVSAEGSRLFFDKAGGSQKTLKLFGGLYHETMNELPKDRDVVLEVISAWIQEKL
jgi:alpha-beta hydrolase superfamily lysophospholipase